MKRRFLLPTIFIIVLMVSCGPSLGDLVGEALNNSDSTLTNGTNNWSNQGTGVTFPSALIGTWTQTNGTGGNTTVEIVTITSTVLKYTLITSISNEEVEFYAVTATASEVTLIPKGIPYLPDEAEAGFTYSISGSTLTVSDPTDSSLKPLLNAYGTTYTKQ